MLFTLFNVLGDITVPVGTQVECKKVAAAVGGNGMNVAVFHNGKELGKITKKGAHVLLPGTVVLDEATVAKLPDNFTAVVVDSGTINHGQQRKAVSLEFNIPGLGGTTNNKTSRGGKQNDVMLTFKVKGVTSKHPGKPKVIAELNSGANIFLSFTMNSDEQIVMLYNGMEAGFVASDSGSEEDYNLLKSLVVKGENLEAKAFGQEKTSYQIKVAVAGNVAAEVKEAMAKSANDAIKKSIIDNDICPADVLTHIEEYLLDVGLSPAQIGEIFSTYKKQPAAVQYRLIDAPHTLYKDTEGVIQAAWAAIQANIPLLFVGDKGVGKNCAIETIAWVLRRPLYADSINRDTDKMDLLGGKTINAEEDGNGNVIQKVQFQPEILLEAMEVGGIYNIDEINFADPGITSLLHSITDDRKSIEVHGFRKVTAADNFVVIGTMNVDYQGTNELNEALNDRFIHVRFPSNASIVSILEAACPGAKKKDIDICDRIYKQVKSTIEQKDSSLDETCLTVRGFIQALKLANNLPLHKALTLAVVNKVNDDQYRSNLKLVVDRFCTQ